MLTERPQDASTRPQPLARLKNPRVRGSETLGLAPSPWRRRANAREEQEKLSLSPRPGAGPRRSTAPPTVPLSSRSWRKNAGKSALATASLSRRPVEAPRLSWVPGSLTEFGASIRLISDMDLWWQGGRVGTAPSRWCRGVAISRRSNDSVQGKRASEKDRWPWMTCVRCF